jgi:hypothetical protein
MCKPRNANKRTHINNRNKSTKTKKRAPLSHGPDLLRQVSVRGVEIGPGHGVVMARAPALSGVVREAEPRRGPSLRWQPQERGQSWQHERVLKPHRVVGARPHAREQPLPPRRLALVRRFRFSPLLLIVVVVVVVTGEAEQVRLFHEQVPPHPVRHRPSQVVHGQGTPRPDRRQNARYVELGLHEPPANARCLVARVWWTESRCYVNRSNNYCRRGTLLRTVSRHLCCDTAWHSHVNCSRALTSSVRRRRSPRRGCHSRRSSGARWR